MAKILLADDDEMMVDLYKMKLGKAGFDLAVAALPEEVWPILEREDVSLVLMDRRLGSGDGLQVAEQIRAMEKYANTPIIFLSNQDPTGEDMEKIDRLGHAEYLVKEHIDLAELVKSIQQKLV